MVVIEAPHHHGQKGRIYRVHVDITVPGAEILSGKTQVSHAHEDVRVAIRDSFDAAQRQLEDVVRKKSGYRVKPHPDVLHGKVARLVSEEGYGFIVTEDGREFFFRRESVISDKNWTELAEGTEVRFSEHEGEQGPHASGVAIA